MSHRSVDFFYLGPPKSASTWVYECLKEHPQMQVSRDGEVYFFDKVFSRGAEWYEQSQFPEKDDRLLADCTPTYIYTQLALDRILKHSPEAKFSIGIRNPVERAFSQYWHVKKKNQVQIGFEESLSDYSAFRIWVEPSMVAPGIAYLRERVDASRIHVLHFDKMKKDAPGQLKELYGFLDIAQDFEPSLLHTKINEAGPKWSLPHLAFDKIGRAFPALSKGDGALSNMHVMLSGRGEYANGISDELYQDLYEFYRGEIEMLEELIGEDLSHWQINPWSEPAKKDRCA